MNTLNITLKSFKHFPAMSEESECFTAIVCLNGKAVGHAKCRGHGDSTCVSIDRSEFPADHPLIVAHNNGSLESQVDDIVNATLRAKDIEKAKKKVARDLSKKVIFKKVGDEEGCFRTLLNKAATPADVLAHAKVVAQRKDVEFVLNLLPLDEAFNHLVTIV